MPVSCSIVLTSMESHMTLRVETAKIIPSLKWINKK